MLAIAGMLALLSGFAITARRYWTSSVNLRPLQ
jgi:hypothetical protein